MRPMDYGPDPIQSQPQTTAAAFLRLASEGDQHRLDFRPAKIGRRRLPEHLSQYPSLGVIHTIDYIRL